MYKHKQLSPCLESKGGPCPQSAMYPCSYRRLTKVHCLAFPRRFLLSALQEDSGNQWLCSLARRVLQLDLSWQGDLSLCPAQHCRPQTVEGRLTQTPRMPTALQNTAASCPTSPSWRLNVITPEQATSGLTQDASILIRPGPGEAKE